MITKKNIKNHELIGLKAKIGKIQGLIIDETKNMIIIKNKEKEKMIPKKGNEIMIKLQNKDIIINGNEIIQKPYDRLKKKYKVKKKWQQKSE